MQQNHRPKNHRLQSYKSTTARLFSDLFGAAIRLCYAAALGVAFSQHGDGDGAGGGRARGSSRDSRWRICLCGERW
jgi:hypothetical protein